MEFKNKATADNINEQDEKGNTRLHEAINLGDFEKIKGLMNLGADPNIENQEGITAKAIVEETLGNIKKAVEVSRDELNASIKNSANAYASMPSDYIEELKVENKKEGREDLTTTSLRQERIEDYDAEIEAGSTAKKEKIGMQREWERINSTIASPLVDVVDVSVGKQKSGRPTLEQATISGGQHVQSVDSSAKSTLGGGSPKSVTYIGK
jgi:hypothetical protein